MSFIGRSTLPQNFLDSVTDGMRLPNPQPQFYFAKMAVGAQARSAAISMGMDTAGNFMKQMFGGAQVPLDFDSLAIAADAYPGAVMAVQGFGLNAGDTIKMRRPIYDGGGYTRDARRVVQGKPTSLTGQNVRAEEVSVVLEQYEGPYDTTSSEVRPYQIQNFDAQFRHNKDQLASLAAQNLMYDYTVFLDTVIRDLFRGTQYITYANGNTSVSAFTAGAGNSITLDLILRSSRALIDRNRKPFPNGKYMCLVPTVFDMDIPQDPAYRQLSAYQGNDRNPIFGYVGTVHDVDIFKVKTLKTYAAAEAVPGDANVVPAGSSVYEGLVFGPDAVGFGQAQGPTCYDTSDTDYGKNAKVLWRSTEAFQLLDERGVQRMLFQDA
jgi:N4-gp56 family major capsid protein